MSEFFFVFHTFFINQFVYQMVSTFYVFTVLGFYIGRFFKCPVFYNVWILQCSLCTDFSLYPLFAISAICNFRLIILCYGVSAHVLRWLISCGLLTTLLYSFRVLLFPYQGVAPIRGLQGVVEDK